MQQYKLKIETQRNIKKETQRHLERKMGSAHSASASLLKPFLSMTDF